MPSKSSFDGMALVRIKVGANTGGIYSEKCEHLYFGQKLGIYFVFMRYPMIALPSDS